MIEARVPLELADKWMADIPKARLIVYPTAGHIPMEELPEQTTRDALLFLRGDLHLTWK
ncbi:MULTISPECIES: alpha/beta fold hydrolase [Marinobacter]|nr:hypothetical protein [Marinobacter sp. F26243]